MSKFYYKEKVIGSGTFGNVWLVKSRITNDFFVLKELNLAAMNVSETRQALTELTVLSKCRHRNIVRYKDAMIDHKKGIMSIIMEYAEGGDLYSAIIKQGNIPFKEHTIITWFTQICLALQYIHHKSILHRDLKSRNIFLTRDRQIKVGDFGISRCLLETNELATTAIGTPYYLSPEICLRKPYSFKSDVWALGCVLFEMASLSHPYQACNFPHLLSLIISGKRKKLPGHCSSLLKDLVERLMKENADERPSVDEILALPRLQPYLSELWTAQNSNDSTSTSKKVDEKICLRRHSSGASVVKLNEKSVQRRSSVSSVESKTAKNRFGFVSKLKASGVAAQKISGSSRSHGVKDLKTSSMRTSLKSDPFATYKVFDPISLRRTKILNRVSNSPQLKRKASSKRTSSDHARKIDESDRGYQSEEAVKHISEKLSDVDISEYSLKTSTKNRIDAPSFEIEQSFGEVFDKRTLLARGQSHDTDEVFLSKSGHEKTRVQKCITAIRGSTECNHSQCQQCMLDMLWKNRIRDIEPSTQSGERTELIRKLEAIFGRELFDNIYHVMIANWEASENSQSPKNLKDITSSLSYNQLQNLPLMMQLIQLDLVLK